MKKILSYILITLILSANFLAPISVGINKGNIAVKKNIALAENPNLPIGIEVVEKKISIDGVFKTEEELKLKNVIAYYYIGTTAENALDTKNAIALGQAGRVSEDSTGENVVYSYFFGISVFNDDTNLKEKMVAGKTYFAAVGIQKKVDGQTKEVPLAESDVVSFVAGVPTHTGYAFTEQGQKEAKAVYDEAIKNGATEEEAQTLVNSGSYENKRDVSRQTLPSCNISSLMGCVVQGFYYILFVPTSYLFALAGTMFDYTFSYSVQDSSYKSPFVVQGWGLVRDFCNMLFIFIMLYVAIGTILNLHSMKTKETIVNVVIIGLFINFSLFATQIIIDASNITARVFYNSNAITITETSANGVTNATPGLKVGDGGIIPLSAALVNKVNPQNLIFSADKINSIKNNSGSTISEDEESGTLGIGQFILIIIMASVVNIVGFTVFITIALLFVARVIGLWLAMILSPLAFFTYILPEMAGTKMIGWKNWWPDTLKMAFLAPVFIFFMYIILKFLQADLISDIASKTLSGDGLGYFVTILIPFAFIMILLLKAKKIAVDMSGEFGTMVTKAGSAIGGLALGAATGGAAFAMRGTLGKWGDDLSNSKFAKTNGRFGRMMGDAGKWTASKSFDVRNTKAGAAAAGGMGVDAGKAKEGGYAKHKADTQKKREERAKSLEVGHDEHEMHDLHEKEEGLQALKNTHATELAAIQGKIDAWGIDSREKNERANQLEQELEKAEKAGTATDTQRANAKEAREKAVSVANNLQEQKDLKDKIRNSTEDGIMTTVSERAVGVAQSDASIAEEEAATARANVNEAQSILTNIPAIEQAAIAKAQADAQAAIAKAQADAQAAIAKAQADAQAAEQAKLTAFNRTINNPSKEATDEYERAKNNDFIAKAKITSVTENAQAEEQAAIAKAQADAQAAIAKAQADAQAATIKAQSNLATTTAIAAKKEESATKKKTRAAELETAFVSKKKIARSMNDLEFQEIPEAKQVVSTIGVERKTAYAQELGGRWFNKKANSYAAHNIRMNAEIKSDGKVGH